VQKPRPAGADHTQLSSVEREVLLLITQGHAISAIAGKLHLSVSEVDTHHAHLTQKLGLCTKTELMRQVLRQRIPSEK